MLAGLEETEEIQRSLFVHAPSSKWHHPSCTASCDACERESGGGGILAIGSCRSVGRIAAEYCARKETFGTTASKGFLECRELETGRDAQVCYVGYVYFKDENPSRCRRIWRVAKAKTAEIPSPHDQTRSRHKSGHSSKSHVSYTIFCKLGLSGSELRSSPFSLA
jgi:hypothetical protein